VTLVFLALKIPFPDSHRSQIPTSFLSSKGEKLDFKHTNAQYLRIQTAQNGKIKSAYRFPW